MREFYAGWFMWAAEVQTGRDRDMDRHKECRERESMRVEILYCDRYRYKDVE